MISPSTPAAVAGIAVGAGPSTRTIVAAGHRPGVLSVFVSTIHDPPRTAVGVTRIPSAPAPAGQAVGFGVGRLNRDQPELRTQIITRR